MPNQRVVVVSTAASQPRYHRRVSALLEAGYDVTVYTFRRGFYEVNKYPQGAQVIDLGELALGKYVRRIPRLLQAVHTIRESEGSIASAPSGVWAFGLDSAFIAKMAVRASTVYEVGDLRNPEPGRSVRSRLIAAAENWMLHHTSMLVVTSEGFLEYYRKLRPGVDRVALVIENKLPSGTFAEASGRPDPVRVVGPIRIGIVGFLRYPRTTLALLAAVERLGPAYELHVYGDGPLRAQVEEFARRCPNVHYYGPFRAPHDLPGIYSNIHVNYVVYDNDDLNVRLALPNKLYESLYFGVPLVVADHTTVAKRVRNVGGGFVVDPSEQDFALRFLRDLVPEAVANASRRALDVPTHSLIEDACGWLATFQTSVTRVAAEV